MTLIAKKKKGNEERKKEKKKKCSQTFQFTNNDRETYFESLALT